MTLTFEGVSKAVEGEVWLTNINLVLETGLTVLVGPNSAGKTTLMRIAAGLDQPSAGRLIEDGEDVTGHHVRRRDVAFVYQEFVNYPTFTVYDNIAAPLRHRGGLSKSEADERVTEVADLLKLGPYLRRRPAELSGGQQQRVAIARALVKEARLLVLDEPLANLDYKLREELRDELDRIFATRDSVVLYSTSEPVEALGLGGHAVVMDEGQVLQAGPAVDAYHRPRSSRVARIFSDPPMNLLEAEVGADSIVLAGGVRVPRPEHFAGLPEGRVTVGLRPHLLATQPLGHDAIALGGELVLAELTGSVTYLHVAVGAGQTVVAELPGVHSHPLGERLSVFVQPELLFAFDVSTGDLLAKPMARA